MPFGKRSKAHVAYFFGREIERWGEVRGAPTKPGIPTHHAKDPALANGMLIAGLGRGIDIDRLAHRHIGYIGATTPISLTGRPWPQSDVLVGIDPESLLDGACSPEVRQVYQANTEEAISRSVFGSPTYVVDGDMFYGQDRLEMVARALERPYLMNWSNFESPGRLLHAPGATDRGE